MRSCEASNPNPTTDIAFEQEDHVDRWIDNLTSKSGFLAAFIYSTTPNTLKRFVGVSDLLQSVWLRIDRSRNLLKDLNEHQFRGWVLCIARRKIIDSLRRYHLTERTRTRDILHLQSKASYTDVAQEPEPLHLLALHEQADRLLNALAELPEEIQQIVALRYSEDLTFQQIAQRLALPVTTCRRRWLEGCQILRLRLSDLF